ncbi:MAG: cupin domain-containing protein [Terricaulis sp.]
MPKIEVAAAPQRTGSAYPKPHDAPCALRQRAQLGDAGGLQDFGVNLLRLPPGVWSSQRHWHDREDEFIYVLQGEVTLIDDAGETLLVAGDCAAFPKGAADGHHLVNKSSADAVVLEVGTRTTDDVTIYSDIDMKYDPACGGYVRRDGGAL